MNTAARVPLKFENTAKVGDTIKAFDFEPVRVGGKPVPEYPDRFVIGRVIEKGIMRHAGYRAFVVEVIEDSAGASRAGELVTVPFQIHPLDYPERVTLIAD